MATLCAHVRRSRRAVSKIAMHRPRKMLMRLPRQSSCRARAGRYARDCVWRSPRQNSTITLLAGDAKCGHAASSACRAAIMPRESFFASTPQPFHFFAFAASFSAIAAAAAARM